MYEHIKPFLVPIFVAIISWATFITAESFMGQSERKLQWYELNRQKENILRLENNINGLLLNVTIDTIKK